jgi:hypothetical protein
MFLPGNLNFWTTSPINRQKCEFKMSGIRCFECPLIDKPAEASHLAMPAFRRDESHNCLSHIEVASWMEQPYVVFSNGG